MRGLARSVGITLLVLIGAGVLWFIVVLIFLGIEDDETRINHRTVWSVEMKTPTPAAFRVAAFPLPGVELRSSPDGAPLEALDWPIVVAFKDVGNEWISVQHRPQSAWVRRDELDLIPEATYFNIETAQEVVALSEAIRKATDDRSHVAGIRGTRIDAATVEVELYLHRGENGQCYIYRVRNGAIEPRSIQPYSGPWNGVDTDYIVMLGTIASALIVAIIFMLWHLLRRRRNAPPGYGQFQRFG